MPLECDYLISEQNKQSTLLLIAPEDNNHLVNLICLLVVVALPFMLLSSWIIFCQVLVQSL